MGLTSNINPMKNLNPLLVWVYQLMAALTTDEIVVPTDFPSQMRYLREIMRSDSSGLINSMLDFSINCALVDYSIETPNANLTEILNKWSININSELRGRVPTGIKALAKEYFRERWKGSSLLVLRSLWEDIDGIEMPTKLWFVDGENIEIRNKGQSRIIGTEEYALIIRQDKKIVLPELENEMIFVQKPFSRWSELYPTPYIYQRGLYKNLKVLELISKKGEKIVGKALEYLLSIRKGSENLALKGNPDYTYSEEDLTKVKEDFKKIIKDSQVEKGTPTYATNFDTNIEHLIPDYTKAINQALYSPIEKRILAGLGLVEIAEGIASSRREAILNPKGFIAEINQGILDFKMLLNDIMQEIINRNSTKHRKYFGVNIQIFSPPIKYFITDSLRDHFRSMYDRGIISKRTYTEVCGDEVNFNIETERRQFEYNEGLEDLMYPPIITNNENTSDIRNVTTRKPDDIPLPEDKQGIEKLNYKGKLEVCLVTCKKCSKEFDLEKNPENSSKIIKCPNCKEELTPEDYTLSKIFDSAPYRNIKDLPEQIKVLPPDGQKLWMRIFNQSYSKGEDYARKIAWTVVKKVYYKNKEGSWVKKSSMNNSEVDLETASVDTILNKLVKMSELELSENKNKLLKKLIGGENEDI